jgi:hypothetical protein
MTEKETTIKHIHSYSLDTENIQSVIMLMMIFVASYFLKDALHYWIVYMFPKHKHFATGIFAIVLIVGMILMAHLWGIKS